MIRSGWKIKENHYVLVKQFNGNLLKHLVVGKISRFSVM